MLLRANNDFREYPLSVDDLIAEVVGMLHPPSDWRISDEIASAIKYLVERVQEEHREVQRTGNQESRCMSRASLAPTVVDDSGSTDKSHIQDNYKKGGSQVPIQVSTEPINEKFPQVLVSIIMPNDTGTDGQNDKIVVNPTKHETPTTRDNASSKRAEDGEEAKLRSKTICTGPAKYAEEGIAEKQNITGGLGSSDADFGMKCLSIKLTRRNIFDGE